MLSPLKNFLMKKRFNNATETTLSLLRELKVPITSSKVIETLEQHPDFPSLLSISDSLEQWKVESIVLEVETETLDKLPTPFIAHTKTGGGSFVLVSTVSDYFGYIDNKGNKKQKSKEEFIKEWNNVVLLAEKTFPV